ncbi:MAG TPA: hypothetical protein DGT23_32290 [Micromonosporaceae bacterium]|nr:hypothetical protein [Micromonosporaceae bacterium]
MQQRISDLAQLVTKELRAAGLQPVSEETLALGGFGVDEHAETPTPMVTVMWLVSGCMSGTHAS